MSDESNGEVTSTSGGRISGVSGRILDILGAGAKSTSDLISEGGFSSAAAFLNLKKLKEQGAVETERAGRIVYYRLADAAAATAAVAAPRRGRKKGSKNKAAAATKTVGKRSARAVLAGASGSLSAALASIAERFSPVADLERKLEVLDQLARSLPREVSSVLKDIRSDLVTRSKA